MRYLLLLLLAGCASIYSGDNYAAMSCERLFREHSYLEREIERKKDLGDGSTFDHLSHWINPPPYDRLREVRITMQTKQC